MTMDIMKMSKKDFLNVPERESWSGEVSGFDSIVILPTCKMHDSGYRCMDFVAVDDKNEPICRLSGFSDVIHINGIGGYGECGAKIPVIFPPIGWKIDCLPCGLLRLFGKHNSLKAGPALSDFELFCISEEG